MINCHPPTNTKQFFVIDTNFKLVSQYRTIFFSFFSSYLFSFQINNKSVSCYDDLNKKKVTKNKTIQITQK